MDLSQIKFGLVLVLVAVGFRCSIPRVCFFITPKRVNTLKFMLLEQTGAFFYYCQINSVFLIMNDIGFMYVLINCLINCIFKVNN